MGGWGDGREGEGWILVNVFARSVALEADYVWGGLRRGLVDLWHKFH